MAQVFRISPLIRFTLLLFYLALTIPLPFLAQATQAPIPSNLLWAGIGLGFVGLWGVLSEQVQADETGIQVRHPAWIGWLLHRAWSLNWSEISALKLRTTGQGGLVYYFVTAKADRAYLLPMRIAGFAQFLRMVEAQTQIETRDVRPLAQPWMYLILLVVALGLLGIDAWTINQALTLGALG
ncbi:MAG: hypothetical protein AAGG51_18370 [Cyanobacteria bacterium P01_G01_bin.54]